MDWQLWQTWLALAMVLGVAEMFSLDLVLLMLAVGALVGVVTALLGAPVAIQVLAAVVTSVAMLTVVRPGVVRRLHTGPNLTLGHAKLVGKQAVVLERITENDPGRVKLSGETWSARPYDETLVIEPGETVDVMEIKGATAFVHPRPRVDP